MNEILLSAIMLFLGWASARIRDAGKKGAEITELRSKLDTVKENADDLNDRVRENRRDLDQHLGAVRGQSLCTRSDA